MKVSSLLKQLIFGPNTHTRARTHTHTHTRTCTRTHTHTRTRTRTCAYTYTHTHTHRQTHYPARGNKISIFLLNDHEYLINIHTCTLRRNQLDYCRHPSSINQYGNKWNTTFFTCVIWYGQWKYRAWQKSLMPLGTPTWVLLPSREVWRWTQSWDVVELTAITWLELVSLGMAHNRSRGNGWSVPSL